MRIVKNVVCLALLSVVVVRVYGSGPCDFQNGGNPIACENTHTGASAANWDIVDGDHQNDADKTNKPDPDLVGFATSMSVNKGSTISFKVNTTAPTYSVDIYRIGYYNGAGARLLASLGTFTGVSQPQCTEETTGSAPTGLVDCDNWSVSASWSVPSDVTSGVYVAKLTRLPLPASGPKLTNHIIFVVRDDASHSAVLFQHQMRRGRHTTRGEVTASTSGSGIRPRTARPTSCRTHSGAP
jgi:hypothetical protein